jgi:hypothetical protein
MYEQTKNVTWFDDCVNKGLVYCLQFCYAWSMLKRLGGNRSWSAKANTQPADAADQRSVSVHSRATPYLGWLVAGFPPRLPGFHPRSGQVGFVVDNVALVQVFSEFFGSICQFSFHRLLHTHHHLHHRSGTIGQLVADVPSALSIIPPQETKKHSVLQLG